MAQKYYAVRRGRKPGIYRTWPETQAQVSGFSGAQYKSFTTASAAEDFMQSADKPHRATGTAKAASTSAPLKAAAITVYTDGGSRNTGNVAGGHVRTDDKAAWAYRIELVDDVVTGSDGEFGASNNRMEIMAFRNALRRLVDLHQTQASIVFVLDSRYVLNAVTQGWLAGWKRRGWKRSAGPLANAELWQDVDRLLPQFSRLQYQWTKGHATNQGNVFVDHLLNETMDRMGQERHQGPKKPVADTKKESPAPASPTQKPQSAVSQAPLAHTTAEQSVADIAKGLRDLPFRDH
ncbi:MULTISPECIES: ribonuclease H family protein [unclassified Levilactobacillus]|uniref:ribonuclease H family protein n=1 Tax=Lactobacillaceae TaxID=33958 RepID=UPI001456F651|nr:ribonuclease [Lactobacillus sp. HBUAS51381]